MMRYRSRVVSVAACSALFAATQSIVSFAAAAPPAATPAQQQPAQTPQQQVMPIGRITAAFGIAAIQDGKGKRPGDVHELVNNDDRIVTDGGGVSVLLASRVVVKVDPASAVSVREGNGETSVILEFGTVHVFVGKRPADFGTVAVLNPGGRIDATEGVFLVSYDPDR